MRLHLARMLVPAALVLVLGVCGVLAQDRQQQAPAYETVEDTRRALAQAQAEGESARRRAEALEVNARDAAASADRTAQESAALAARIQQSEAEIAANRAADLCRQLLAYARKYFLRVDKMNGNAVIHA